MKRLRINLFTLIVFPTLLVAANCVALSWLQYENVGYFTRDSAGVNVGVTSDLRLTGWPFAYNVAFINAHDKNGKSLLSTSNAFTHQHIHWHFLLADIIIATIAASLVYLAFHPMRSAISKFYTPRSSADP
ncbi:hypothetical protein Poly51_62670 [Rubripirellula tenax]|uniref:Uncharacterized protein n=1 Tax=Rubripirellula tenax TaxID=2528015 RepID=A0A5C6E3Y2_9BACT|nr:hypothetical protein Poly51_62670 [Rubripirellula tenax]